jgi:4-amino-4-deoxy-L-arabinose transferase-like glycosyltransferase
MLFRRVNHYLFAIALLSIFIAAMFLQSRIFFHEDVSWLMHAAERMLAGGTYSKNFFDPDPPMILYLYSLPVSLAHLFSISHRLALRIGITLLVLLVLFLCHRLNQYLFSPKDKVLAAILLLVIAVVFVVVPVAAFGQREHLFVILIMPYLFLVAVRGESKRKLNLGLILTIGLLAGLGFSIKPFFLFTLFFVEILLLCTTRNLMSWLRVETLVIGVVTLCYVASVFLFFPDYFSVLAHCYQFFFSETFFKLRSDALTPSIIAILISVFILYLANDTRKMLGGILLIAVLSTFVIFLVQGGAVLYYHIYPTLSFVILLLNLLMWSLQKEMFVGLSKQSYLAIMTLLILMVFSLPFMSVSQQITYYMSEKKHSIRQQIITVMKSKAAYQSCYFITAYHMAYPMVDYAKLRSDSKFYNFSSLSILESHRALARSVQEKISLLNKRNQLIDDIVDELKVINPHLIFVDLSNVPGFAAVKGKLMGDARLDSFWRGYQLLKTVGYYDVYERSDLRG